MLETTNYKLKKIELADSPPDITIINPNWDTIDAKLKTLEEQNNTLDAKLGRVEFSCTPLAGYKIVESKCYAINKVAYLELAVKKTDDTTFATGFTNLVTIPHSPVFSIISLSAIGMTTGGTPLETKASSVQRWNKTLGLNVAVANVVTLIISGQYLID